RDQARQGRRAAVAGLQRPARAVSRQPHRQGPPARARPAVAARRGGAGGGGLKAQGGVAHTLPARFVRSRFRRRAGQGKITLVEVQAETSYGTMTLPSRTGEIATGGTTPPSDGLCRSCS